MTICSAGAPNLPLSRFSQSAPGAAYAVFVGETKAASNSSLHPRSVIDCYLGLARDARFAAPARTAGLLMAGLFAVFSSAPRVLLEGFVLSPVMLGLLFARRCIPGVRCRHAGAKTVGAVRALSCDQVWPGSGRCRRGRAAARGPGRENRCCHFLAPLRSSCSVWELRARCRVRPRYRHSATRPAPPLPCLASRKWPGRHVVCRSRLSVATDPAIGLGTVLALTSLLALILHGWRGQPK